jgi:hypothetical protein
VLPIQNIRQTINNVQQSVGSHYELIVLQPFQRMTLEENRRHLFQGIILEFLWMG